MDYDFQNFLENSEIIVTDIDRNEFKAYFRKWVNNYKQLSGSTPAAIIATIGWLAFNDSEEKKCKFSHVYRYNDKVVLITMGDEDSNRGILDLRLDFDFFEKVLGYKRGDVLAALRLFEQTKALIASGMFA